MWPTRRQLAVPAPAVAFPAPTVAVPAQSVTVSAQDVAVPAQGVAVPAPIVTGPVQAGCGCPSSDFGCASSFCGCPSSDFGCPSAVCIQLWPDPVVPKGHLRAAPYDAFFTASPLHRAGLTAADVPHAAYLFSPPLKIHLHSNELLRGIAQPIAAAVHGAYSSSNRQSSFAATGFQKRYTYRAHSDGATGLAPGAGCGPRDDEGRPGRSRRISLFAGVPAVYGNRIWARGQRMDAAVSGGNAARTKYIRPDDWRQSD